MSIPVDIWVVKRQTGLTRDILSCYDWDINIDGLEMGVSSFKVDKDPNYNLPINGDFILVQSEDRIIKQSNIRTDVAGAPALSTAVYIGVVDSVDNFEIKAREIPYIANSTIVCGSSNGDERNPYKYMFDYTARQLCRPEALTEHIRLLCPDTSILPGWAVVFDKPKPMNLDDIYVTYFKRNQAVQDIPGFTFKDSVVNIYWWMHSIPGDEVSIFETAIHNLSVYEQPQNYGAANAVYIQDSDKPIGVVDAWYMKKNGDITNTLTRDVSLPVSAKGYYFDIEQNKATDTQPAKTHADVARSELRNQNYQHEITFSIDMRSPNAKDILTKGRRVAISYQQRVIHSLVTGYKISSDSYFATVSCGNIRSTLSNVLDGTDDN